MKTIASGHNIMIIYNLMFQGKQPIYNENLKKDLDSIHILCQSHHKVGYLLKNNDLKWNEMDPKMLKKKDSMIYFYFSCFKGVKLEIVDIKVKGKGIVYQEENIMTINKSVLKSHDELKDKDIPKHAIIISYNEERPLKKVKKEINLNDYKIQFERIYSDFSDTKVIDLDQPNPYALRWWEFKILALGLISSSNNSIHVVVILLESLLTITPKKENEKNFYNLISELSKICLHFVSQNIHSETLDQDFLLKIKEFKKVTDPLKFKFYFSEIIEYLEGEKFKLIQDNVDISLNNEFLILKINQMFTRNMFKEYKILALVLTKKIVLEVDQRESLINYTSFMRKFSKENSLIITLKLVFQSKDFLMTYQDLLIDLLKGTNFNSHSLLFNSGMKAAEYLYIKEKNNPNNILEFMCDLPDECIPIFGLYFYKIYSRFYPEAIQNLDQVLKIVTLLRNSKDYDLLFEIMIIRYKEIYLSLFLLILKEILPLGSKFYYFQDRIQSSELKFMLFSIDSLRLIYKYFPESNIGFKYIKEKTNYYEEDERTKWICYYMIVSNQIDRIYQFLNEILNPWITVFVVNKLKEQKHLKAKLHSHLNFLLQNLNKKIIPTSFGCECQICNKVLSFLRQPLEKSFEIQLYSSGRNHISEYLLNYPFEYIEIAIKSNQNTVLERNLNNSVHKYTKILKNLKKELE